MNKAIRIIITILLLVLVAYLAGLFDPVKRLELWQTLKNPNWFWLKPVSVEAVFLSKPALFETASKPVLKSAFLTMVLKGAQLLISSQTC